MNPRMTATESALAFLVIIISAAVAGLVRTVRARRKLYRQLSDRPEERDDYLDWYWFREAWAGFTTRSLFVICAIVIIALILRPLFTALLFPRR